MTAHVVTFKVISATPVTSRRGVMPYSMCTWRARKHDIRQLPDRGPVPPSFDFYDDALRGNIVICESADSPHAFDVSLL